MPTAPATVAVFSYGLGAVLFLGLTALLLTAWRGRLQGGLLVFASVASFVWCAGLVLSMVLGRAAFGGWGLLEIGRDAAWYLFFAGLLGWRSGARGKDAFPRAGLLVSALLAGVLALQIALGGHGSEAVPGTLLSPRLTLTGLLALALVGLVWVEQVYRNTPAEQRWALKPLCIGLGGVFAYDFFLYASAALFGVLDPVLVVARGAVNAVAVPFIALAVVRNPQWSLEIFVSRQVVFHSAAFLGAGVYLLGMAGAGYYIKVYGGSWGALGRVVFLCAAVLLLISLLSSGKLRSRAKVFVGKHFFKNKYDYREEWLRFTRTLSRSESDDELKRGIVRGIAEIVDAGGGVLWVRRDAGEFVPSASWNLARPGSVTVPAADPLPQFLSAHEWVVSLEEYRADPAGHDGLRVPAALDELPKAWIIVPLKERDTLLGFILLTESVSRRQPDWEDCDLLKTVGRQAASYLALMQATEALADSRQFEAFNRLSAFVVHDLKNVAAQLSLVTTNARKFIRDPAFVADAMGTVEHATAKMNRLLAQLRQGRAEDTTTRLVNVGAVARKVAAARSRARPAPRLGVVDEGAIVSADPERLAAIVEHLVQNAQEATPEDGSVELAVRRDGRGVAIEVIDTGAGMDARFVSERLFRPFDTTKGNAGMGIGVYESREFAHAHGGSLEVQSQPGAGSRFTLWMPAEPGLGQADSGAELLSADADHLAPAGLRNVAN